MEENEKRRRTILWGKVKKRDKLSEGALKIEKYGHENIGYKVSPDILCVPVAEKEL